MHVCGQTLVLVDNDTTVSEVNQKIVKATLKYMFYHRPEDRAFCFNTYEHDTELAEEFTGDVNDLVCSADTMEYVEKDHSLSDTLAEVITRWKDSDFACRDILVFTDGLEGEAQNHEKEELNYLLENSGYPVYVVLLNQDNNAGAKKGLLSIAVPSGGRLFETEMPDSEAGIDRLLTEQIFSTMDGYAQANWKQFGEAADTGDAAADEAGADITGNPDEAAGGEENVPEEQVITTQQTDAGGYMTDAASEARVVYEYNGPEDTDGTTVLVISAALIAAGLLAAILGSFVIMKRRRTEKRVSRPLPPDDEEYFEDYELKGMGTVELDVADNDTVFLPDSPSESDTATRLLTDTHFVKLTDKTDAGSVFRIMLGDPMIIGRGRCDVVIPGDDALSKRHCEIFEREGKAYVRDLSSANGTKVNSRRIQEDILSDGDELTIGSRTYRVGII